MTIAQSLASFLLAAGLLTLTPGLDTALVLRVAATEGASKAARASLGVCAGTLCWGMVVGLGLGVLLAASEFAFTVLKWVGVGYLSWLGLQLILRPSSRLPDAAALQTESRSGSFRRGLLQNLLNPKVGVFYVSFLPQFVPHGVAPAPCMLLLAVIHGTLGFVWFALLVLATRPLVRLLRRPNILAAVDRIVGTMFLLFGAQLAMSRR